MQWRVVVAVLGIGCCTQAVADVRVRVPPSADSIVLQLPERPARDAGTADRVAVLIAMGARSGEERYYGIAERLVDSAAPGEQQSLRLLKARLLQHRHAFIEAISALDTLVAQAPHGVEARLMRAQVRLQLMQPRLATQDCQAIQRQVAFAIFATCAAQVRASLGDVRGGYALVQAALGSSRNGEVDARSLSWSAGVAAELAQRLGNEREAGRWYEQAWRLDHDSHYVRLGYADWLLEQQRYEDAARVVAAAVSMPDRLRQVLASRNAKGAEAVRLDLAWQEALARGERSMLLDQARFLALLTARSQEALALAQAAFAERRDADSARLLFRIATITGDSASLARVDRWRRETGYVDVRLSSSPPPTPGARS